MGKWYTSGLVRRGFQAVAMGRAFLRYRNPRRRAVGRHHAAFHRVMWQEAAREVGAQWRDLGWDIAEIERGGVRTRVVDNVSGIDDPVTLAAAHNKLLTHRVLAEAGLPVPKHAGFTADDLGPALAFLRTTQRPCVVKPAGGTGGGRGVTTGIRSGLQLAWAAALAAVYGDELMIEEQVEGENYRLLYLDGELLDAMARRLPWAEGDGRSTVRQLVDRLNEARHRSGAGVSQVLLTVDFDMKRTLAGQGLTLRSVPEAGRRVTLKTVVNENGGADNTTARPCEAVVEAGARAARAMNIRFAGIDIVTSDVGVPLERTGGVILEVNGTPNLYYHYKKADGPFPVATHLLRRLLDGGQGGEAVLAGSAGWHADEAQG